MSNPKVSIIVPCWGVEKYLDRCVGSLVNQTLHDIEIILVDDESQDNVPQMCDDWADKDPRIKVIHKKNSGLGLSRNSGINLAKGQYITFCDSDDYVDLNAYETLYNKALELNTDVLYGWHFKETENLHWENCCKNFDLNVFSGDSLKCFMLDLVAYPPNHPTREERATDVSVCMALYRNDIIQKYQIRFHSERDIVSEDLLFNVDFLKHADIAATIPFVFYYYCYNDKSLSQTFKLSKFNGFKRLRQIMCKSLEQIDSNAFRTNRMFIGYCRAHVNTLVDSNISDKYKVLKDILSDPIWVELKNSFEPNFLPIHSRISYFLTINNYPFLLYIYTKIYNFVKLLRSRTCKSSYM